MHIPLLGLYAGGITQLAPEGQLSGIIKQRIGNSVHILQDGIEGDVQADRRVHGGPEKALHQFAAEHFADLQATFPAAKAALIPGSIGENLSTKGMTEANSCIGDVFRWGTALIQVSQPRRPCWKIDRRYDEDGIAQHIALAGCTGWYFRVLEVGRASPDDALILAERPHEDWQVLRINELEQALRPPLETLNEASHLAALNSKWRQRFAQRFDWRKRNP